MAAPHSGVSASNSSHRGRRTQNSLSRVGSSVGVAGTMLQQAMLKEEGLPVIAGSGASPQQPVPPRTPPLRPKEPVTPTRPADTALIRVYDERRNVTREFVVDRTRLVGRLPATES